MLYLELIILLLRFSALGFSSCIAHRDGRMTVGLLMKYLVNKLGLENAHEVLYSDYSMHATT